MVLPDQDLAPSHLIALRRCRANQYQKKAINDGAVYYRHKCATVIQQSTKTSEGSVASDAGKLAKPVLLDTECLGQQQDLTAAGHALFMHACVAEQLHGVLLLPFIACCRLSLGNQQQTIHQRLPYLQTRVGGAGHAPHRISKLPCLYLSNHAATHTIAKT
eukprot:1160627-Pelagomonas_calceolata.AAC.3